MLALSQYRVPEHPHPQSKPELLDNVDGVFEFHMFLMVFSRTVFLLFPFSRLVRIWTAPFNLPGSFLSGWCVP